MVSRSSCPLVDVPDASEIAVAIFDGSKQEIRALASPVLARVRALCVGEINISARDLATVTVKSGFGRKKVLSVAVDVPAVIQRISTILANIPSSGLDNFAAPTSSASDPSNATASANNSSKKRFAESELEIEAAPPVKRGRFSPPADRSAADLAAAEMMLLLSGLRR